MGLDFSPLEMIQIIAKVQSGKELTKEEKVLYEEYKRKQEKEMERLRHHETEGPERERQNREDAVRKMELKFCPLIRSFCVGERCALMKVLEKPRVFDDDGFKHFEAMCAFNIPDKNTRISYDR